MGNNKLKIQKFTMRDIWLITKFLFKILKEIVFFIKKVGPFKFIKAVRRYPWIFKITQNIQSVKNFAIGRTGNYLEAVLALFGEITIGIFYVLEGVIKHPEKLVVHQVALQPEIPIAMGLRTLMAGFVPWVGSIVSPKLTASFIDSAENAGMPPDVCSASVSVMGFANENQLPDAVAILASSMPCDSVSSQYTYIERKLKIPTFFTDAPYDFFSDRATEYYVKELKRMIAWLEENTPGKMDWEELRKLCEKRNSIAELELELWEMVRQKPSPMAAEPIWISHLWFQIFSPGGDETYRMFKRIVELTIDNLKKETPAVPDEKYRTILWNAPTIDFSDIFAWAEKKYKVSMLMDMTTYNHHPFIDTETNETMLRGLAQIGMQSIMGRHTRGPFENYINDIFHLQKLYNIDMLWTAASMGCKNTKGLLGILREKCREANLPMLVIDHEIFDARTVPREDIMKQVDNFMVNVMNATPITV